MVMPLNRVIIFVSDVQRCARFYRDVFGFSDVGSEDAASGEWVELETGGCRQAFHKARGPGGPIDRPTGGPGNPHKMVFHAEVEGERARLVACGVAMGEVHRCGEAILCDGSNPEGHVFQISSP